MAASNELQQVEESFDWSSLITLALADPPQPGPLSQALNRWAQVFQRVYVGLPLAPDYPAGVWDFFETISRAGIPPDIQNWICEFERTNSRSPKMSELPSELKKMLPKGNGGRPRCDVAQVLNAARAWEAEAALGRYAELLPITEMIKETIKRGGAVDCFGFIQESMEKDSAPVLARSKLSDEFKKSDDQIKGMIYRNRPKK